MSIFYWIIFGLIVGVIANFIAPSPKGGIIGSIVLGIIGVLLGDYLGKTFFDVEVTGFNIESFVVAVSGAILVIFISRLLMRGKKAW